MEEHLAIETLDLDDGALPRFQILRLTEHEPGTTTPPQHATQTDLDLGVVVIRGDRGGNDDL